MAFEIGHYYKITLSIGTQVLTYICRILNKDETFITFKDIKGNTKDCNINAITLSNEVFGYGF